MTKVDFYIYKLDKKIEKIVCQLSLKAWQNKISLYIHTNSQQQINTIDDLLWTFKEDSFIPHDTIDNFNSKTTIYIGNEKHLQKPIDMLININEEVPLFFSQFSRIAEIVIPQNKEFARKRYKFYKDRGYPLKTYNLDK